MSYLRSASVSPSVIPKPKYYQSDDEREEVLSPSRRLGVFQRRTTPSIYDYSRNASYEDEDTEDEDEGEYSRGTPVRSPPRLYQPSRYVSRERSSYVPRRIEF
ncbi:hypothetical protein [Cedratvirus kamchatka]|uniref:Uncharacterized protein n=1 Tax=Cedratvirus kamchatka TaxID=2716914 RepID=A0A6G8MYB5_9VIRU|nr:hypothetical protein [Cedratvirus kamchatka]WIL04082.1 hypothetical protein Clen_152 [Cedratvirus lena]WIL04698.1 hypothetical protein Cduv_218 [Cedratvirus duvanny]